MPSVDIPDEQLFTTLFDLIANELGVPAEELQDEDTRFSELGVDPILAPCIIGSIFRRTALQLQRDVFQLFPDVRCFKRHIAATRASAIQTKSEPSSTPPAAMSNLGTELSVLIQGSRKRATKNIFLFPDGSGSAMAYARLPKISPDVCLYGMNSPFLRAAGGYTCSVDHLASIWADEIANIQRRGPYILGGWSAGGYYAYEAMKHLHRRGEIVEKLVFIDSPCRTDFEALPIDVVLFLSSNRLMGNWGGAKTPSWLVDHFEATLKAVDGYQPTGVVSPPEMAPEVFVIWASDPLLGADVVAKAGLDLSVKVTRFLLERRTDFGPNGWDKLFPGPNIMIATMPGNHFNIVHPPNVSGTLLDVVVLADIVP
jgi:thioesterase domain-containing protein